MPIKNSKHPKYIPIIKWQTYEQYALENLSADVRKHVLPCIEIRTSQQHQSLLECFSQSWGAPSLIDYANPKGLLTNDRISEYSKFLNHSLTHGLPIIPVLNPLDPLTKNKGLQNLINDHGKVCYRIRVNDLSIGKNAITSCAVAMAEAIDNNNKAQLIIDLGRAPESWDPNTINTLSAELISLKSLGFSDINIASGSFPASLAAVIGHKSFERKDWMLWNAINTASPSLLVGYSDYGILAPEWSEEILTKRGGRVAIRYARHDSWLILRGNNATKSESIALSRLMVTLHKKYFMGGTHSYGSKLIEDRADPAIPEKKKKAGHYHFTEAWNHHISFVVKEQY